MSDTPARPPFRSGAIAEPRLPVPDFPAQEQPFPGLAQKMDPLPDHGETSYRGAGRLSGKRALITGGDSGIGAAQRSPLPARVRTSPSAICPTNRPMPTRSSR